MPLWRVLGEPARSRTLAPAAGWFALFVAAAALVPGGGCTPADPCDPAVLLTLVEGLTVVGPVALWLLPRHARSGAGVLLAAWALTLALEPAGLPVVELLGVALLLAGWTLVVDRVERDRRTRLAEVTAGVPHAVWPGPAPEPAPWEGLRLAAALGLLALVLLGTGLLQVREARAATAAAARTTATVTAHGDDGYLVTVDVAGRPVELDTWDADDYPVGSRQPVLLLEGGEVRLAAEPPDPFGALALAQVVGTAALVRGLRARRRVAQVRALLHDPQPVLALQAVPHPEGALLLPADAGTGEGPALAVVPCVAVGDVDVDVDADAEDEDEDEDDEEVPQQPVLLWGLPVPGEVAALRTRDGDLLLPLGPNQVAPVLPDGSSALVPVPDRPLPVGDDVQHVLRLRPPLRPLALLVALLAVPLAAGALATADGLLGGLLRAGLVADVGVGALLRLLVSVELTDDALVAHGAFRTRVLPWRQLRSVDVAGGGLVATTTDDAQLVLPLPGAWTLVLRRQAHAARLQAAAQVLRSRLASSRGGVAAVHPRPQLPAYLAVLGVALLAGLVLR